MNEVNVKLLVHLINNGMVDSYIKLGLSVTSVGTSQLDDISSSVNKLRESGEKLERGLKGLSTLGAMATSQSNVSINNKLLSINKSLSDTSLQILKDKYEVPDAIGVGALKQIGSVGGFALGSALGSPVLGMALSQIGSAAGEFIGNKLFQGNVPSSEYLTQRDIKNIQTGRMTAIDVSRNLQQQSGYSRFEGKNAINLDILNAGLNIVSAPFSSEAIFFSEQEKIKNERYRIAKGIESSIDTQNESVYDELNNNLYDNGKYNYTSKRGGLNIEKQLLLMTRE